MRKLILHFLAVTLLFTGLAHAADPSVRQKIFTATIGIDGVQRVEITGGEYYFDPNYIIVKKNIPVEFVIKKVSGIIPHNIVIEAPQAGMNIREAMTTEAKIIHFTPTETGRYPIICDKKFLFFANHREKGMEGVLEVVE